FQAEDGIRDFHVTGVQTCALPIIDDRELGDRPRLLRPGPLLAGQQPAQHQIRPASCNMPTTTAATPPATNAHATPASKTTPARQATPPATCNPGPTTDLNLT